MMSSSVTLAGVVGGQITLLALWASWSPLAFWKRALLVLAYAAVPNYFVLLEEWWFGGTLTDRMTIYLLDALSLLVLMAAFTPIRWLRGYRLFFSAPSSAELGAGRFRLAELFSLTLVVAGALTLLVPGGAKNIAATELIFQAALLILAVGFVTATLLPCLRVVSKDRLRPLGLAALVGYLTLAVFAGAEIFFQFINVLRGPIIFPSNLQLRLAGYLFGAGYSASILLSLIILCFAGMRITRQTE